MLITSWIFKFIRLYAASYLHLGLCTILFILFSFHALDYTIDVTYIKSVIPVIMACYCFYHINHDISSNTQPSKVWLKRWMWVNVIIGISYFDIWNRTLWWLAIPLLITIAYIHPYASETLKIRKIGFLKNIMISVCFTMVTATIPLLDTKADPSIIWNYSGITLILYLILTILFDIRDSERDKLSGKSNVVNILGLNNAKMVSYIFMGVMTILAFVLTNDFVMDINSFGSYCIMTSMLAITIWNSSPYAHKNEKRQFIYYDIWAESLPALPFVIMLVV